MKGGNCLIEALKNKIKNISIKIYYVKPYTKDGLPHFCWQDNKLEVYRHYTYNDKIPWWKLLWFDGYIDNFPYDKLKIKLIRIL